MKRGTRRWAAYRADWQHMLALIWEGHHPTIQELICRQCGQPVLRGQEWDLGHRDDVATYGENARELQPEHSSCNRAEGGRLRHRQRPAPLPPSRRW